MKEMKAMVLMAGVLMGLSLNAAAAKESDAPPAACEGLKIATGPAGKGYAKVYRDIAKVCGASVRVCEVQTTGGLDNLNAMSTKEADIGLAALDTWLAMKGGDENIQALQGLFGLNANYLHVVVAANGYSVDGAKKMMGMLKGDAKQVVIQRFSDLRGKRVALVGSAQLLGRQLNKSLGYGFEVIDVNDDSAAFAMVNAGTVAAALSLSGWPSGAIKNLKQDSGLSLVPFDSPVSAPYIVKPINYKSLGVYNNNALAVANVMFTRPFKGEKAGEVAKLRDCIGSKMEVLQEGDFEPAWNEVKSLNNTFDVPRFKGAAMATEPRPPKK